MPDRLLEATHASATDPGRDLNEAEPPFDIDRWAELLATNRVSWPADICPEIAVRLSRAVRERRRSRLVTLIARLIAADLIRKTAQDGRTHVDETD